MDECMFRSGRAGTLDEDLSLPARLDSAAAGKLAGRLLALRGRPVTLTAGDVSVAGALGVQVLVAARRQWAQDGPLFRLAAPSAALLECCELLGVPAAEIGTDRQTEMPA